MHYTAMAGLSITPHEEVLVSAPALSTDLLAIVVAIVAFAVSGIFLLALVPDRRDKRRRRRPAAPVSARKPLPQCRAAASAVVNGNGARPVLAAFAEA